MKRLLSILGLCAIVYLSYVRLVTDWIGYADVAGALLYAAFLGLMHLMVVWLHLTDEQDVRD